MKTCIVGTRVPGPVTAALSRIFKIVQGSSLDTADIIIPGICTTAFLLLNEDALLPANLTATYARSWGVHHTHS